MPSSSHSQKPNKRHSSSTNPNNSASNALFCKHSPSATLDILILVLVLFSGTFLITSYLSYIFQSLSQIIPSLVFSQSVQEYRLHYILGFLIFCTIVCISVEIYCYCICRLRKCERPGCKGLQKAMEFDILLQTEEDCLKSSSKVIDNLPCKDGTEGNPDYECLRSELRRMAPPNGRAVLLFRARCGCPVAKMEAWGPKRGKRHKKALGNMALDGGGKPR